MCAYIQTYVHTHAHTHTQGAATDFSKTIEDAMLQVFPDVRARFDAYTQQQQQREAAEKATAEGEVNT